METSLKITRVNENLLIWAIVSSILLHILLFVVIPAFKFDHVKKMPDVLKVVLVQPKKSEPVIEKMAPIIPPKKVPEPIKPEPIKPKEIKPPPIKNVVEPQPEHVKTEPAPKLETRPVPVQTEPQVPVVIATTPKAEEKPAFVAPTPQLEAVTEEDISAAKNSYIKSVHQELKRNHRYPKMAERNGVSGEVKVEIKFDNEGDVIAIKVVESSGNTSLDEGALATVKRSNFKQYMKQILVGHIDTIIVPIVFTLASQ